MEGFTIIDGVVALVIVLSALLAYGRGLVRELMAIVGWVAAAILAFLFAPQVEPLVREIPVVGEFLADSCELSIIGAFAILLVGCTTSDSASKNESSEPANNPLHILDNAIVEQPNDPSVYHDRAVWKLAQSDPQGAFDDWDLALRADSGFALAWEEQADMLFQMQKFEDCLSKLDGCL